MVVNEYNYIVHQQQYIYYPENIAAMRYAMRVKWNPVLKCF